MTLLVLLPGMFLCDGRLFERQIAGLREFAEVGVGDLTRDDTIGGMAARVLAAAPPRFALAGLSMGGIVAMEVLRREPEAGRARGAHGDEPPGRYRGVGPCASRRSREFGSAGSGRLRRGDSGRSIRRPRTGTTSFSRLLLAMALDLGPEVFARQSRALRDRPEQTGTLTACRCPALVFCGAHDTVCPVERHREMAGLFPAPGWRRCPAPDTSRCWSGPRRPRRRSAAGSPGR